MVTCVLALGCLSLVSAGLFAVEGEVAFLLACSRTNHTRERAPQPLCPTMQRNCSVESIPLGEALASSWPSWALIAGVGLYGAVDMPLQALVRANIGFFYSPKTLASDRAEAVRTTLCSGVQSHSDGVDRLGAGYSFFTLALGLGIMTSLLLGYTKVPSLVQSAAALVVFAVFMVCIQFLPKPPGDQADLEDEMNNTVSDVMTETQDAVSDVMATDRTHTTGDAAANMEGEATGITAVKGEPDQVCAAPSEVPGPPTGVVIEYGGGFGAVDTKNSVCQT